MKILYNQIWTQLTIAALSVSTICSCSSDYLDTEPNDKTSETSVSKTVENLYAALNGTHRSMYIQYSQSSEAGESSMHIFRDMLGEDVVNSSVGNGWFINEARWLSHRNEKSSMLRYPFVFYYGLILNANLILENIDAASGSEALKDGIRGESLCFRAFGHFQLVQLYGKRYDEAGNNTQLGIPYKLFSPIATAPRNTVEDVYTLIHTDLDTAIENMQTYQPSDVNHFSLSSAYGLKARVYLTQGNWIEAANYAEKAIVEAKANGVRLQVGKELLTGFVEANKNPEWMWASLMPDDQTIYFYSFFSFMSWNFNSTANRSNPKAILDRLYKELDPSDIRSQWWDPTGELEGPTESFARIKYQNRKFTAKSPSTSVGDIVYMRLSEMYLIQAEALSHAGNDAKAQALLREWMLTRNPDYDFSGSGNELLDEILVQRRIELWGEGFRFTDLKRLDLQLDRLQSNQIESVSRIMEVPAGDKRWQFLIPVREIETNPEMKQNEL